MKWKIKNLPIDSGIIGLLGFGLIFKDSTTFRIRLIVFLANFEDFMFHDVRPFWRGEFADGNDVVIEFSKPLVNIIKRGYYSLKFP